MAMSHIMPKSPNWWMWGGAGAAVVAALVAALYWFDVIGVDTETVLPAPAEQSE